MFYANIINFEFKQIKSDIFLLKTETNSNRPTRGGVQNSINHWQITNYPPLHLLQKSQCLRNQILSISFSSPIRFFDSLRFPTRFSIRPHLWNPPENPDEIKNFRKKVCFWKKRHIFALQVWNKGADIDVRPTLR